MTTVHLPPPNDPRGQRARDELSIETPVKSRAGVCVERLPGKPSRWIRPRGTRGCLFDATGLPSDADHQQPSAIPRYPSSRVHWRMRRYRHPTYRAPRFAHDESTSADGPIAPLEEALEPFIVSVDLGNPDEEASRPKARRFRPSPGDQQPRPPIPYESLAEGHDPIRRWRRDTSGARSHPSRKGYRHLSPLPTRKGEDASSNAEDSSGDRDDEHEAEKTVHSNHLKARPRSTPATRIPSSSPPMGPHQAAPNPKPTAHPPIQTMKMKGPAAQFLFSRARRRSSYPAASALISDCCSSARR